ncbi:MAG: phosphoribosylformylglycinamidine synthase subunit PurS [Oligoflexia bacterium]|nr:phosphoribosylformylglycinamidine synthase subunit PurS [Oligoflexia bacterium]
MKFSVEIMPRPEALDPQGRAVQGSLQRLGFTVEDCRVGKVVIVDVKEENKTKALEQVHQMAEKILANPLIETFEVKAL